MNKALTAALFAAAFALAGCGANAAKESRLAKERNPAPCPNIVVLSDAARQIEFAGAEQLEDVAYTAEIQKVDLQCRYFGGKPIDATARIAFSFGRGPKGADANKTYTYFVAVTRKDAEVIEKAEFQIPVKFKGEGAVVNLSDKIDEIVIPRASEKTSGSNFEVVVGLSVTPKQAIFNRSGKSLKFPELK